MTDAQDIDARLVALLDGALSATEAEALRAEIADDPALTARLAALDVDMGEVRDGLNAVLAEAPAAPMLATGSLPRLAIAASLALALFVGGALIGARGPDQAEDWRDFAAAYHLLYRTETLAVPVSGDGGVALVSEALGRDMSDLAEVDGLEFRRAQILGWEDQALIQFAYLDPEGRPVAVCLMEADGEAALASAERHGLSTATFQNGALQVLIIGAEGMDSIDALARHVQAQL